MDAIEETREGLDAALFEELDANLDKAVEYARDSEKRTPGFEDRSGQSPDPVSERHVENEGTKLRNKSGEPVEGD